MRWMLESFPSQWRWVLGEELTKGIEQGEFLDVCGTNFYKAKQVQELARLIHGGEISDGDSVFFLDLWFPLEQLFYMLDGIGLDVKVGGVLHAGAYDDHDFLSRKGMGWWAAPIEAAWWSRCDDVFVFSEFHRKMLMRERSVRNIRVVEFPYDATELNKYRRTKKDLQCVFPHRMAPEKSPWLIDEMRASGIDVTTTAGMSKTEYYLTLSRAQYSVSWNEQETFGIAMAESAYLGAHCLMPRRLSYPELWRRESIVDSVSEMISVIKSEVRSEHIGDTPGPFSATKSVERFGDTISKWAGQENK